MRVLLLGAGGQLGSEVAGTQPKWADLKTCDYPKVDFSSETSIRACVERYSVDWIVNAAGYTAVDKAETEAAFAWQINCQAVKILATICREKNIRFLHVSTDFVFSGEHSVPYGTEEIPDPVSVYGESKSGGEKAVINLLGADALIIRTAWLYSLQGENFVKTMLRLMMERDSLSVVDDQIGTPTWARGLAETIWLCIEKQITGIHHWTDAGVASWYDFAVAIQEEALAIGLLEEEILLLPVGTKEYPTPAKRPHYSVLDKSSMSLRSGRSPVHWRKQLRLMLKEMVL